MSQNYSSKYLFSFTFLLSLLMSTLAIHNSLPNNDGILYIKAADVFLNQGLKASLTVYHWPLLSILIAAISKTLSISTLNSAYLITALLQGLLIISFLKLFKKLNPTSTQLLFAIVTILIFPQINEYRHYILRDWGFWAFSLLAVSYLCDYCNNILKVNYYDFKNILLYYINFIIAFLFRGEALIIMLLLPLGIFCLDFSNNKSPSKNTKNQTDFPNQLNSNKLKKVALINLYKPLILAIIVIFTLAILAISLFATKISTSDLAYSLYINLHFNKLAIITNTYSHNIDILNKDIFTLTPLDKLSSIIYFIAGATTVFITKYISVINIFNLILLALTYKIIKANLTSESQNTIRLILFSVVLLSLLPLGFLYLIFVTAGRYYILSTLLLLLFIPFGLDYYWQKLKQSSYYHDYTKLVNSILSLGIVIIAYSGIISSGYSKAYIKHAGNWFKQQNLPTNQTYSNNSQLNFLSGLNNNLLLLEDENQIPSNPKNISYLLLKVKKKQYQLQAQIKDLEKNNTITVLNKFSNKRGDQVVVIKYNLV